MEEERNIIAFVCFNAANCNGVGNSEMVYSIEQQNRGAVDFLVRYFRGNVIV